MRTTELRAAPRGRWADMKGITTAEILARTKPKQEEPAPVCLENKLGDSDREMSMQVCPGSQQDNVKV